MKEVLISRSLWQQACQTGADEMVSTATDAIHQAIGGELNADNMPMLNAEQITLLAWSSLHEEVMDGGFVQLIHNGYGPFIFLNPFARAVREWGLADLASLINRAHKLYSQHHEALEKDCTDEEFMALFEQYPQFDDCDDEFVEHEEEWTRGIAGYVDSHRDNFFKLID